MQQYRTHTCGVLSKKEENQEVILSGWVNSRRDHGGLIFIDLRDRYGITQITFDPEVSKSAWETADKIRTEYVIRITGTVISRPNGMINSKLGTGEIEVEADEIEVLSESETPPFEINDEKGQEANELIRLEYRFLDLRRKKMQEMLKIKDQLFQHVRNYFQTRDFIEVQTPILANSSPEGARDFLIPSRIHPGKFYALPQAPQQFKQLLMVGGLDKYFQIAPCFRDEDPRMDRAYGEFYQIDMEMSFVEQDDIFEIMEPLFVEITEKFSKKKIVALNEDKSFQRIPWREALERYGSDKPDLRFDLEIKPISDLIKGCGFSVFSDTVEKGGAVHALKIDGGAKFSRKEIDELTEIAKEKGAKGLAYIIVKEGGEFQSPIVKFLGDDLTKEIASEVEAVSGDIIFFGADKWKTVCSALGSVRNECATRLGLKDNSKAAWCWIVDFPMFAYSEIEEGRIDFEHNPFSMPRGGIEELESKDPLEIINNQFDISLNGFECLSGGIRNHKPKIMYKAFEITGYTKEEVDAKFGGMIKALKFGAPPHGGCAPGVDRILMTLCDYDSIRDIYAFPKDGKGRDLMMDSPSAVRKEQLDELGVKLKKI